MLFDNTNPAAFKKVLDFIYHKKPFKIGKSGASGSSYPFLKELLEVLGLANKLKMEKLVKFCEMIVVRKLTITSDNSLQVTLFYI